MELKIEINYESFKDTIFFTGLRVFAYLARVALVTALLYIPCILCCILLPLLGVKNVFSKVIDFFESIIFISEDC